MGTRPAQGPKPPSLLFFSSLAQCDERSADTGGRTSIIPNRPENIPHFFPQFSHTAMVSASALTFLTLEQPSSLSSQTLYLTFTCFLYHVSFLQLFPSMCHNSMCRISPLFHIYTDRLWLCLCNKLFDGFVLCQYGWNVAAQLDLLQKIKMQMFQDCRHHSDPQGAEWVQLIPSHTVWMFSLWGSRVYQWMSSLSLLSQYECSVSLKYEYWHRVRRRGEKALKTHWPPHWLHVWCREALLWYGPVTLGLTDMWCFLNCITLSLHSIPWTITVRLQKMFGFLLSLFTVKPCSCTLCTRTQCSLSEGHYLCVLKSAIIADAKCPEVGQIYWAASEWLEWISHTLDVFSSFSLPHIWAQTHQCSFR